jgi:hypothetical protein
MMCRAADIPASAPPGPTLTTHNMCPQLGPQVLMQALQCRHEQLTVSEHLGGSKSPQYCMGCWHSTISHDQHWAAHN